MKLLVKIKNIFVGNKVIANTGWMMGERIFQMVLSLLVSMLVARYLGPTNYGIINYVAAFIAFVTPICNLGLEGVIVKKFVDDPENTGKYIGTAIIMEFIASLLSSVTVVAIVAVSNAGDSIKIMVAILESVSLLFKSTESIEFWFQSQLKSKYTAIIKMIAYTIMSLYRIVLLLTKQSVVWFAFATSVDMIVIALLYLPLYKKKSNYKLQIDLRIGAQLISESYHFILAFLMVVIYAQMDKIMIQHMLGDYEVGLYTAASTISNLWFLVPAALIASARPVIMKYKAVDEKAYQLRLKQLYASIFWLGIVVSLIITVGSKLFIWILYGVDYIPAANTLSIIVWYGSLAQLGSARNIWIICEKKNKYNTLFIVWGMVANLILNFIGIPILGIDGAALATLLTEVIVCIIAPLLYKETRNHTSLLMRAISLQWMRKGERA